MNVSKIRFDGIKYAVPVRILMDFFKIQKVESTQLFWSVSTGAINYDSFRQIAKHTLRVDSTNHPQSVTLCFEPFDLYYSAEEVLIISDIRDIDLNLIYLILITGATGDVIVNDNSKISVEKLITVLGLIITGDDYWAPYWDKYHDSC